MRPDRAAGLCALPRPVALDRGIGTGISGSRPVRGFTDPGCMPTPWAGLDESRVASVSELLDTRAQYAVPGNGIRPAIVGDFVSELDDGGAWR